MKKKLGRPTTNPKIHQTRIRMTDEERRMLNSCAEITGKTKTDIIIEGLKHIYEKVTK